MRPALTSHGRSKVSAIDESAAQSAKWLGGAMPRDFLDTVSALTVDSQRCLMLLA